jgi:hypothetical protein
MKYSEQREAYLAAARRRTAARRVTFTAKERAAYLKYLSDYGKANRDVIYARTTLWRYERNLKNAVAAGNEVRAQKLRAKLAALNQLIHNAPLW